MSTAAMMLVQAAEARRRRDEKGRYMDGDQDGQRAAYTPMNRGDQGNNQYTRERRDAMDDGADMRDRPDMRYPRRKEMTMAYSLMDNDNAEMRRRRSRMDSDYHGESTDMRRRDMGGEGYFVWDNANQPYMPPERYGQPVHRQNVTDMRYYRTRSHMDDHTEKAQHDKGMIGFGGQDEQGKKLTKEKAEKWVKHMRSGEHKGGMWNFDDAKELAKEYGIEDGQELVDFYAALNMMHSDYNEIAKEYGVDREDFYAALACAFLYDNDGKPPTEKLAAYYKYVVPHDEED